jgi:hypothetical protein
MVAPESYSRLAHCFSPSVLEDIAYWGRCGYVERVVKNSGFHYLLPRQVTLGGFFDHLYAFLRRKYRFEYIYKNALANKILLGRHSLKTSTLMTELKAGRSKADLVILNGTSTIYEIKTELDTLGRLEGQLASYLRVFDRIYVVTHESLLKKVERAVSAPVGVILLTKRHTLRVLREAGSNASNIDPSAIFKTLRRSEYRQIIETNYGSAPDPEAPDFHHECERLFSLLPPQTVHDGMVRQLRGRVNGHRLDPFVTSLPSSLRLLCLTRKLTRRQQYTLLSALSADFKVDC